jgi:hypothetical protein
MSVPLAAEKLVEKEVEKLLKGGVKVKAEVCLQCGGRLYPEANVRRFGHVRHKLATEDVAEFHRLGQTDQVA